MGRGYIADMETVVLAKDVFLIRRFWPAGKCDQFIQKSEDMGYEAATVQTELGPRLVDHIRNNNRVVFKDIEFARELWTDLEPFAPAEIGDSVAIGLNELFRFYKYEPGQHFRKHRDQSYIRNSQEASYYTLMIYLNDGFKGGETKFDSLAVRPGKGDALIFYHYLEHEGSELIEGIKYVLRTDIMYRLKSSGKR